MCLRYTGTSLLLPRLLGRTFEACVTAKASPDASRYCMQLVKKHDYDHYLCNLLLPKAAQNAAFAVRAFNVEVAMIQDMVSERNVGLMRLQFWKEALDGIYKGDPPQQPVAVALAYVLEDQRLSKHWLTQLIKSRESALSTAAYLSTSDMETYAEKTFSSLLYLTLEAAGVRELHADHAASHLGKAEGIVTFLRSIPYNCSRRQVLIPMDILVRHGVSQEDILRRQVSQQVKDAIYDFASLAHTHLTKAHSLAPHLNSSTKIVLLPSVVCERFLERIQLAEFDPFSGRLTYRDSKLALHLLWRRLRKRH